MKINLILAALFVSTSAMANPFSNFVGTFHPISKPDISPIGNVKECNWLGFKTLNEVKVYAENGQYVIEISSAVNNSPLRSFVHVHEYRFSDWGIVNEAKISGGEAVANYTVTNTSGFSSDIYFWEMRRVGAKVNFYMSERRIFDEPGSYGCAYAIELSN
jgi:hypothetical protein